MIVTAPHRFTLIGAMALTLATAVSAQTWQTVPLPPFVSYIGGVTSVNNRLVASTSGGIHYTDDGVNWSVGSIGIPPGGTRIIGRRGTGYWLRSGPHIFLTSDTFLWPRVSEVPSEKNGYQPLITTIGNGAVATSIEEVRSGNFIVPNSLFYASDDMITWRQVSAPLQSGGDNQVTVFSLVSGGEVCLASYWINGPDYPAGQPFRAIGRSLDKGKTWELATIEGNDAPIDLAWGNGMFMGITMSGRIMTSRDGRHFAFTNQPTPTDLYSELWFGDGLFFAHSTNSRIEAKLYATSDGSDWQSMGTVPVTNFSRISGITHTLGKYFIVGATGTTGTEPFIISLETPARPKVLTDPLSQTAGSGYPTRFVVSVEHPTTAAYQWTKDDVPIPGATTPQLAFEAVQENDAGTYRCLLANNVGTSATASAKLTVIPSNQAGRLTNLSVNTFSGSGDEILNLGFVLRGQTPKPMTLRGVGPSLVDFGVIDVMTDPSLQWIRDAVTVNANDNWSGDDGRVLGAFPLPANSLDAVISTEIAPGVNSILVQGAHGETGNTLTEIYDGNTTDGDTTLRNLSARGRLAPGASLIVGFVIEGTTDLPVVLRAIGPTLVNFGVGNTLPDPQITLYADKTVIATNDNWAGDDGRALGAFPLPEQSKDAALAITLSPGIYTAHVSASAVSSSPDGIVLLEIYDAR